MYHDTDINRTSYSRVKHYIVGGKAYSYEYDDAGNISKITDPNGSTVEYTYDDLGQLVKETYSSCLPLSGEVASANAEDEGVVSYDTIAYTYDTRGNILSKTYTLTDSTTETINYGYTDATWKDRLTSYNGISITADAIGNPLSWHDGSSMSWQHGRQLATHTKSGVTSTYTYNDEGIRTSKTTGGITTEYYVIDGTLRRMTDGTNTLRFVYGNGLSSVIFNGTEYWYVFNAQGDVIGLINVAGEYVVEYTYDAWGKPLSKTGTLADTLGTLNPFRYRGYVYDEESGFYYVTSRYYDPEIGRWLNSDSVVVGIGGFSLGYNLFTYCYNNPTNYIDTNGMWVMAISFTAMGNFLFGGGATFGIVFDGSNWSFYSSTMFVEAIPAVSLTGGLYYNPQMETIAEFEGKSAQIGFGVGAAYAGIPLTASVEVDTSSGGIQFSGGVGVSATPVESHIIVSETTVYNKPSVPSTVSPTPTPSSSYISQNSVSSSNMYVPRATSDTSSQSFVASAYTVRF